MVVDLYFPAFLPALTQNHPMPYLSKLAAVGAWHVDTQNTVEMHLCEAFGIRKSQDWPLAALSRMGEGLDLGDANYFIAHPAHFALQRDHFTLDAPSAISVDEARQLIRDLNAHFAQDGLKFEQGSKPDTWFLCSSQTIVAQTFLWAEAHGRDVRPLMPQGEDGMRCRSIMNQAQMLLHEHPVNQARELNGLSPVNSIWLSGGASEMASEMKVRPFAMAQKIFASDALTKGLAKSIAQEALSLPKHAQELMNLSGNQDALVVMDEVNNLDADWFLPLLSILKKAKIKTLRCHFGLDAKTFTLTVTPKDTWKFWRRIKPITQYFAQS